MSVRMSHAIRHGEWLANPSGFKYPTGPGERGRRTGSQWFLNVRVGSN
ncbi:MAG: hypothetical protein HW398_1011 [Acidobacteria bacterium]|nr:hypothetical protein [Acidobacteriota bacterium]